MLKMRVFIPISCLVFSILIGHSTQDTYDGHYDLKARDTAYLCGLMDDYLKTGKQPDLSKSAPDKVDKISFLKGKPCWRFTWIPCDAKTYEHTNQRPCGWYKMEKAPEKECD